jgi:hypothetical protein
MILPFLSDYNQSEYLFSVTGQHGVSAGHFRLLSLKKEDVAMSSSSESASWLDRWWPLLVIIFGVIFVSVIVSFSPRS